MDNFELKQHITKEDVINVLNSIINEKNRNSVNQYIDKISNISDFAFKQELDNNNISTIEDVRDFFIKNILRLEKSESDKTKHQSQEFKKCTLNDLDIENAYFHFTDKESLKSIRSKGLVSDIGKHSEGIDEKPSIFFSYGMIPTIQGADVWIKWIMHRMYGEKNQFHIYDGLDEDKIKLKQSEWATEFLNKEYLKNDERKEEVFEQDVSKIAKGIIAILFRDYWATDIQKEKIIAKQNYDRCIIEEQKK